MNCPHCKTPIREHDVGPCLDAWVERKQIKIHASVHLCPPFSTDIAAAWELVEAMGYLEFSKQESGAWVCWIGKKNHAYPGFMDVRYSIAETAPLAICRAYILSRGERTVESRSGMERRALSRSER